MLLDQAANLSPVMPREARTAAPRRKVVLNGGKASAGTRESATTGETTTAAALGIRRITVRREHLGHLGDVVRHTGDNSTITLSGGDGTLFTWWRVNCQPVTAAQRLCCRSPEGCRAHRLKGRSYCAKHHARYSTPKPTPSGHDMTVSPDLKRRRRRTSPRLDLLERKDPR